MSPRISANDLNDLLKYQPNELCCLDIRSTSDYNRVHLPDSINIPYNTLQLDNKSLESLNIPQIEEKLLNRIIICISNIHENAVDVSKIFMNNKYDYYHPFLFDLSHKGGIPTRITETPLKFVEIIAKKYTNQVSGKKWFEILLNFFLL